MNAFLPDTLLSNADHTALQKMILELAKQAYQNEKGSSGEEIDKSLDVCKKHIEVAIHLVDTLGTSAPTVKDEDPDTPRDMFPGGGNPSAIVPSDSVANLLDYSNLPNEDTQMGATEAFFNQDGVDIMVEIERARSHPWFGDFEAYIKTDVESEWVFGT